MPEHYTTDYQPVGPRSTCIFRSTDRSNRQSTCWCTGHPRPGGTGTAAAVGMAAEAQVETLAAQAEVEALAVALAAGVGTAEATADMGRLQRWGNDSTVPLGLSIWQNSFCNVLHKLC